MSEWQPIETYDAMKKKPTHCLFWFAEKPPSGNGGNGLPACASLNRNMGFQKMHRVDAV